MEKQIPLSVPNFIGNELRYVTEAVKSEWVSSGGPYVEHFENKIAEYVKAEGAAACQNGTSGLHTALMLCGVKSGQEVIVPTLTFIAAVNPIRYIGAEPVFMDCDDSLCMDPEKLEEFCCRECIFSDGDLVHKNTNKIIKCLVTVHVFGNMADMESIMDTAQKYHLKVVEDATEAIGTYYETGKYARRYAGTIGNAGVYSFNGNKIITTGGGGMIVSNDPELIERARHLTTQSKSDPLYYMHDEVGYNYRMTNLQAALGLAQLECLEQFIQKKKENYSEYESRVRKIEGLRLLPMRQGVRCNYWFYSLYCDSTYGYTRDELIQDLSREHIQVRPIWGLIHEQLPYQGCFAYKIEKALKYVLHVINIPCSTKLTKAEIETVVHCLETLQTGRMSISTGCEKEKYHEKEMQ